MNTRAEVFEEFRAEFIDLDRRYCTAMDRPPAFVDVRVIGRLYVEVDMWLSRGSMATLD